MEPSHGRLAVMCMLASALLAGAGCGGGGPGAANVDNVSCKTADDCVYLPVCAERATCDGGICRYEAKRCDTPPAPECLSGDTVYRIYLSPGTCQADGTCRYPTNDMSCGSCATQCLGTCQGMSCADTQGGCRSGGRCVPGSPPTCKYDVAPATQGCDDSDLCSYGDHCDGDGHCAASKVSCVSDPGTCGKQRKCNGTATCDESYPAANVACDDGSPATYGDHCDAAGHCVGTGVTCAPDPGPCGLVRKANGTATCAESYPGASVTCDDGNASTYGDHCNGAGGCTGTPVSCTNDPGPCGAVRTANGTAQCTVTYAPSTVSCGSTGSCSTSGHCDGAGQCVGASTTADGMPCDVVLPGNAWSCKSCQSGVCSAGCINNKMCRQQAQGAPYTCN